ncbi:MULTISPECIES: IS630 transposase-related protein [unclassified Wolbachia]|nr:MULTISPECIES: IS630 transposase-related protein [unclassified Wolbachia]
MAYSVDLREKAVLMIEKGKTKVEVAELMEIGRERSKKHTRQVKELW